jgi:hypothetical protein
MKLGSYEIYDVLNQRIRCDFIPGAGYVFTDLKLKKYLQECLPVFQNTERMLQIEQAARGLLATNYLIEEMILASVSAKTGEVTCMMHVGMGDHGTCTANNDLLRHFIGNDYRTRQDGCRPEICMQFHTHPVSKFSSSATIVPQHSEIDLNGAAAMSVHLFNAQYKAVLCACPLLPEAPDVYGSWNFLPGLHTERSAGIIEDCNSHLESALTAAPVPRAKKRLNQIQIER